ncbi:MAG: porin [Phocaeicola sp.]
MRRVVLTLLLAGAGLTAIAQKSSVRDTLTSREIEDKVRNMPNIEVGKGVSFMPKDSLFKVNIRFRMQNLAGFSFDDDFSHTQTDLMVKRLRLRFEGYMLTPKLTYMLQLGFTPYDTNTSATSDFLNIVRDAMIWYIPSSNFNLGFGQTKIQANRARVNSSSALQFVDRSIVNSMFQIDRDFGLFATYYFKPIGDFSVVTKGSITSGDGRNNGTDSKFGLAYTGRLEIFPFGRFKGAGDIMEGDFMREESPKVMLAGTVSYNQHARNIEGQRGNTIYNGETRNISSYFLDFILKYQGFAFYADYMARSTGGSAVIVDAGSESFDTQYMRVGQGLNLQTSYIFPSNWEIALRNSTIFPKDEIKEQLKYKQYNQTTIGVTKYLIGHSLKLQLDASYNAKKMVDPTANGNGYEFRVQVELGI